MRFFLLTAIILTCFISNAQSGFYCGSSAYRDSLRKWHPDRVESTQSQHQFETIQAQYLSQTRSKKNPLADQQSFQDGCDDSEKIHVVPVVFHVVHKYSDTKRGQGSNIADQNILNGLQWLNDAFNDNGFYYGGPTNTNPIVQEQPVKVEFEMILVDGQGSTNEFKRNSGSGEEGICRWPTPVYSQITQSTVDNMMGFVQQSVAPGTFSPKDVLNIYIVDEIEKGDLAGLATFPSNHGRYDDGVVVINDVFGGRDLIKILVHEVGHYLGLDHTFEGGCTETYCSTQGDKICDTPPSEEPMTYRTSCDNSCSNDALISGTPFKSDQPDLCENYMDYSPLTVQNSFTVLQKKKMRHELTTTRKSLLDNLNWIDSKIPAASIESVAGNAFNGYVCENFYPSVEILNFGQVDIDSILINVDVNNSFIYRKWVKFNVGAGKSETVTIPELKLDKGKNKIVVTLYGLNASGEGEMRNWEACATVSTFKEVKSSLVNDDSLSVNWVPESSNSGWTTNYQDSCDDRRIRGLRFEPLNQGTKQDEVNVSSASINLNNQKSCWLRFNHAYTHFSADYESGLKVSVTNDCWEHETTVLDIHGDSLKTTENNYQNLEWSPRCGEWRSHLIDLSSFTGSKNIHVKLTGYQAGSSGYGNSIFLSDVEVLFDTCSPENNRLTEFSKCGDLIYIQPYGQALKWSTGDQSDSLLVSQSSTYWVIYEENENCIQRDSFEVTLHPNPIKPTISRNNDLLLCDISNGSEYEWYLDGVLLQNSNSNSFKAESTGVYQVSYYDQNGCIATSDEFIVQSLGIRSDEVSMVIYPNPSKGSLNIQSQYSIIKVEAYDLQGRSVEIKQELKSNATQLNINASPGIYILNVLTSQGVFKRKIEIK